VAGKKKKRPTPPQPPVRRKPSPAATAPAGATRRQQQRSARRTAQRRDALSRWLRTAGLVALVLGVVGGVWLFDRQQDAELRAALTSGGCEVDTDTDPTRPAGLNHVQNPTYAVDPPAGGDHLASAARGGVYEGASVPEEGSLVHSLEHGYVIVWHQPDLPREQRRQLEDFERRHDGDVIVAERASLPVRVAATAWGHRLLCKEVELAPLDRFFEERVGDGPENVERG
jgi:hypothetical protein